MSINKMTILGNVGQDPEIRYTASGDCIANFSVATNEKWKDKQTGEQKERTEWHRVVAFRHIAQLVADYVKSGDKIYLEGQMRTRKWQDQSGQDRYSTELTLSGFDSKIELLGAPRQQQQQQRQPAQRQQPATPAPPLPPGDFGDFNDDIPF